MAGDVYSLSWIADVSRYQSEIAQIPGMTAESAAKAAAQLASKMQAGQERSAKAAEKAARDAVKAAEKAAAGASKAVEDTADRASKGLNDLSDLARGLGLGPLEDVADGMRAIVEGGAGLGMVAAGGAAAAGAVVALGVGIVKAVQAADELVEETQALRDIGALELLEAGAAEEIRAANDAMNAIGTALDEIVIAVAADFAPAVQEASTLLVAMALATLDAAEAVGGFDKMLVDLATFLTREFLTSLAGPVGVLVRLAKIAATVSDAVGAHGMADSIRVATGAWDGLVGEISRTAVEGWIDAGADSVDGLRERLGDSYEEAQRLVGGMGQLRQAGVEAGNATSEALRSWEKELAQLRDLQADSASDLLSDEERVQAALERRLLAIWQIQEQAEEGSEVWEAAAEAQIAAVERADREITAIEEKRHQEEMARADEIAEKHRAAEQAKYDATADFAMKSLQAASAIAGNMAEESKAAAFIQYGIQRTMALTQIALDTPAMITSWSALLGPPGAIAATTLAALQMAAALSVPPPKLHSGGVLADEQIRSISTLAGEEILGVTRRGIEQMGGQSGIRALNRGQGQPPLVVPLAVYDHRIQALGYRDSARLDSQLRQDITRGTRWTRRST